jgi:hypothetical protein
VAKSPVSGLPWSWNYVTALDSDEGKEREMPPRLAVNTRMYGCIVLYVLTEIRMILTVLHLGTAHT